VSRISYYLIISLLSLSYHSLFSFQPTYTQQVFSAQRVAYDLVHYSNEGYFGISTGLDGWLLKQLHPGMSPANHLLEV